MSAEFRCTDPSETYGPMTTRCWGHEEAAQEYARENCQLGDHFDELTVMVQKLDGVSGEPDGEPVEIWVEVVMRPTFDTYVQRETPAAAIDEALGLAEEPGT